MPACTHSVQPDACTHIVQRDACLLQLTPRHTMDIEDSQIRVQVKIISVQLGGVYES